jgi:dTDP-4-amino-4,6-dideoxygalactose transaminase
MSWPIRELPPTSGLPPRSRDLLGRDLLSGNNGTDLEAALAAFLAVPETLLCSSGSACLVVALSCLKRRSAARTVIVPAYTCPLVVLAAHQAGCRVLPCDIMPDGLDLDLEHLRELVNEDTLCVVPTHYGGAVTDVDAVRRMLAASAPHVAIVEDAAQAFGARYNGQPTGTIGDIGFFSFATGKGLTLIEGGCLIARDAQLRAELRQTSRNLLSRAPSYEAWHAFQLLWYHLLYAPRGLALAYGLPRRLHLARGRPDTAIGDRSTGTIPMHTVGRFRRRVGVAALARLPQHLKLSETRLRQLAGELARRNGSLHPVVGPGQPTSTFLIVRTQSAAALTRILERGWSSPLGLSKLFMWSLGGYPALAGLLLPSETPNADRFAATTLTLTTSPFMTGEEQTALLDLLGEP